jgi:hypothetical protein
MFMELLIEHLWQGECSQIMFHKSFSSAVMRNHIIHYLHNSRLCATNDQIDMLMQQAENGGCSSVHTNNSIFCHWQCGMPDKQDNNTFG